CFLRPERVPNHNVARSGVGQLGTDPLKAFLCASRASAVSCLVCLFGFGHSWLLVHRSRQSSAEQCWGCLGGHVLFNELGAGLCLKAAGFIRTYVDPLDRRAILFGMAPPADFFA